MKYVSAKKSGRAFNGFHKDAGHIVHAVDPLPENTRGDWFTKAMCGAEPGRRGNGWERSDKDVNCQKCIIRSTSNNE